MKKTVFTGVATALVTPMNADLTVNYDRLEKLVDEQISGGVDGLVICGTTGESATLNHEDHVKVLEVATKAANHRVPIIAGTGSNDTAYAVELSQSAQKLGVDALLMVTPYYNKATQNGLVAHYTYVADRVDLPIILYNVPSRTGVDIKPETYYKLAQHKNIVAAKEANGDLSALAHTISLCGDALDIYSGNDDQIVPILSLGGKGVISVLSNIAPKETHDICELYFKGDVKGSRDLQIKYIDLISALFCEVNPIPVKEAMNLMGMNVGPLRLPLTAMEPATKQRLMDEMKKVGLL